MGGASWTQEDILSLSKDPEAVITKMLTSLSKEENKIFAAKLGFGVPKIDLVAVDKNKTTSGYILKFPVVDEEINTLPYFQGFGEAVFLTDQMLDESFLLIPDIEISDNTPFTRSPDPRYRLGKETYEAGICLFDRHFNIKVWRQPKGSMAKHYWRLKLELLDSIDKFGEKVVKEGEEEAFENWKKWVNLELEKLGDKKLMNKVSAAAIVKQMLGEKNYRNIEMDIREIEINAEPTSIPVFNIKGRGLYLGNERDFSLQLSRISGMVIKRNY
jgi:hypothetical protein